VNCAGQLRHRKHPVFRYDAACLRVDLSTLGVLKHLDFFDSLPVGKVQEFISIVERESFKKGEIIINEGTIGEKFYIICSAMWPSRTRNWCRKRFSAPMSTLAKVR